MLIRIPAHKPKALKSNGSKAHKPQQTVPVIRIPATKVKEHHEPESFLSILPSLWESIDDDLPPEYRMTVI